MDWGSSTLLSKLITPSTDSRETVKIGGARMFMLLDVERKCHMALGKRKSAKRKDWPCFVSQQTRKPAAASALTKARTLTLECEQAYTHQTHTHTGALANILVYQKWAPNP